MSASPSAPPAPVARTKIGGLTPPARPAAQRLLLVEFNELCPALLRRFMDEGVLPNFRRFHDASTVFTTDAGEPASHLEPWVQWPTVHAGVPFAEHKAYHLGDGRKIVQKCLAEVLSDAGLAVGVCGSMNLNYGRLNGYVLPDPWDAHGTAWPDDLGPYARTVARLVQESSRQGASKGDLFRLGWFLLRHGLSIGGVWLALRQLAAERRDRGLQWRRACVLDRFQYDLFRHLNRRHGVRFATFFCNSTAHFQHYYWRNMEPGLFEVPPPATDSPSLRDAIRTGYRAMDRLLGRLLRDYADARLVLCTALSQRPWSEATKCTYRPRRFGDLFAFAGLPFTEANVRPVMAEQFHLDCGSDGAARDAETALRDLHLGDEALLTMRQNGDQLFVGCRLTAAGLGDRPVVRRATGAARPFGELFYQVHTMRSGRHHPDGVLWVRTGRHCVVAEKVPLTAVAPTLLAHFGVAPPATMRGPVLEVE